MMNILDKLKENTVINSGTFNISYQQDKIMVSTITNNVSVSCYKHKDRAFTNISVAEINYDASIDYIIKNGHRYMKMQLHHRYDVPAQNSTITLGGITRKRVKYIYDGSIEDINNRFTVEEEEEEDGNKISYTCDMCMIKDVGILKRDNIMLTNVNISADFNIIADIMSNNNKVSIHTYHTSFDTCIYMDGKTLKYIDGSLHQALQNGDLILCTMSCPIDLNKVKIVKMPNSLNIYCDSYCFRIPLIISDNIVHEVKFTDDSIDCKVNVSAPVPVAVAAITQQDINLKVYVRGLNKTYTCNNTVPKILYKEIHNFDKKTELHEDKLVANRLIRDILPNKNTTCDIFKLKNNKEMVINSRSLSTDNLECNITINKVVFITKHLKVKVSNSIIKVTTQYGIINIKNGIII